MASFFQSIKSVLTGSSASSTTNDATAAAIATTATTCEDQDPCQSCTTHDPATCDHLHYPQSVLSRIEMNESMVDSIKAKHKHILLVTPAAERDWPKDIADDESSVAAIFKRIMEQSAYSSYKVMITATDGLVGSHVDHLLLNETNSSSNTASADATSQSSAADNTPLPHSIDVWCFPDAFKCTLHTMQDIITLLQTWVVKNEVPAPSVLETRRFAPQRHFVFVCTHKRRDNKCGVAGPILIEQFNNSIEKRQLLNIVLPFRTSHIGGHKFAATLIMYPGGVCYGRVMPCDVDRILDEHVAKGTILRDLYRGRVGPSTDSSLAW